MLMFVSLQNGGLNQTTFLFLFFPRLFPWLLLLTVSVTLRGVWPPLLFFLALELRSTGVKYSSLPWNPLSFRASSYLLLFSSNIFLPEDSLLILWFTALGICLSTDLGVVWGDIYVSRGGIVLTKRVWTYHYLNSMWRPESLLFLNLRLFEF